MTPEFCNDWQRWFLVSRPSPGLVLGPFDTREQAQSSPFCKGADDVR